MQANINENNLGFDTTFEQQKWEAEKSFREREIIVQEREQKSREAEIELKRKEQAISGWRNPLVITILAAALAAFGNAGVTLLNGRQQRNLEKENGDRQRQLERDKSEQTRILEMIKTADPDKAAVNLKFLIEAGLISDVEQQKKLKEFLANREEGTGPSLPAQSPYFGGIIGTDDAIKIETLTEDSGLKKVSKAVGRLETSSEGIGTSSYCTAFLIGNDIAVTSGLCITGMKSARLFMFDGDKEIPYQISLPPLKVVDSKENEEINYAILRVEGNPGLKHGTLSLSSQAPEEDQPLTLIMFRGDKQKLAVPPTSECRVVNVDKEVFNHICDTGAGSAGAPVLSADGNQVVGVHFSRNTQQQGVATRADLILQASKVFE
ncbi:MAG TPA: trypsin-like peptidase domain-containing protein [Pyrinomonadaceae bacterium]|jgi:hypothetical protein